ncbi:hypothetical protein [Brevibacillus laterosporus]|uniref:Uncharacterized protein n=1 Tax=Brevibacillus laterosporus TaxID=1465 RepID=A0AAP8QGM4_BRELA|nr:hypothetical protein [Brevibacillus laterosporus]MBG9776195.1 hypothetical protein [Brevibacillus laterosporus]PPB12837.1 hypothetical protein C4A77_00185 [Brevibacillus laterosporus]
MKNTTYDEIYTTFINRCKVDDLELPKNDEQIYNFIHGAIMDYNNRLQENLDWDDTSEAVSQNLKTDDILLIAHYLRLTFLKNQLIYFTNLLQPFSRDFGIKNYQAQIRSFDSLVAAEEKKIENIIQNRADDFL